MSSIDVIVESRILHKLQELGVLDEMNRHFLVAYSGGPDSTVLLQALQKLSGRLAIRAEITAVYVNHNLRSQEEISLELRIIRDISSALSIHLHTIEVPRNYIKQLATERDQGLEEAARFERYRLIRQYAAQLGADYILTAHTHDDQVETLLMRFFQGSGLLGLQGIAEKNDVILRPLLGTTKKEINSYLAFSGIEPSIDSTNNETVFLRNRLRRLIPEIIDIFPGLYKSMTFVAEKMQFAGEHIMKHVDFTEKFQAVFEDELKTKERISFEVPDYLAMDHFERLQFLWYCWERIGSYRNGMTGAQNDPTSVNIGNWDRKALPYSSIRRMVQIDDNDSKRDINRAMNTDNQSIGTRRILELADSSIYTDGIRYFWVIDVVHGKKNKYLKVVTEGDTCILSRYILRTHADREYDEKAVILDFDTLNTPLIVRSIREGDRIKLQNGWKPVAKLLQEWKIPVENRWKVPILEDRNGILAVLGSSFNGTDRISIHVKKERKEIANALWFELLDSACGEI